MFKRITVFLSIMFMVSVAFTASAEEKVILQYAPKAGTTTKYQMKINGTTIVTAYGRPQRTTLDTAMTVQQKVTGIDKDGNVDIETTVLDGTITVNNTPTTVPNMGQIINVKMAKDGKILSQSGSGAEQQGMGQMQIQFPTTPVSVGKSWTNKVEPTPQMPIPMETKYTVVAFEKVAGRDCAKIKSDVKTVQPSSGSINLTLNATGFIWFAYKEGYMVKNEVKSDMRMIMDNDLGNGKKEKIETRMNLSLSMGLVK